MDKFLIFAKGHTSKLYRLRNGLVVKQLLMNSKTTKRLNKVLADFYPHMTLPLVLHHEITALRRLKGYDICPEVIDVGKDFFTMTDVGNPVTKNTRFKNLGSRIEYIIECLEKEDMTHNDLRRDFRNYTCLDGVLYLVDFQISDFGDIRPGAAIRKGHEQLYNNNREDLEWFKSKFEGK